jgi:hypothetical protein
MMLCRSTRLADQLDAALDGRAVDLPDELVGLVALAERIRDAARGLRPDPADLAHALIRGTCLTAGGPNPKPAARPPRSATPSNRQGPVTGR